MRDITMRELGPQLERIRRGPLMAFGLDLKRRVARNLYLEVERRSPVGSNKTSRHPGKYRSSHTLANGAPLFRQIPDAPGYGIPGLSSIAGVLAAMTLASDSYLGNAVRSDGARSSYAPILENPGVDKRGRRIGSPQAPRGVYGPAVDAVLARAATLVEQSVRAAWRDAA